MILCVFKCVCFCFLTVTRGGKVILVEIREPDVQNAYYLLQISNVENADMFSKESDRVLFFKKYYSSDCNCYFRASMVD